jgi:hypothetical protein
MFKRYILASLVAGFALSAQFAVASNLVFYPGHGYLEQPPFTSLMQTRDSQPAAVISVSAAGQTVMETQTNSTFPEGSISNPG